MDALVRTNILAHGFEPSDREFKFLMKEVAVEAKKSSDQAEAELKSLIQNLIKKIVKK